MFDTIHHIAIIGSDYEKSKHFYVDLLGLKVIYLKRKIVRDLSILMSALQPQLGLVLLTLKKIQYADNI